MKERQIVLLRSLIVHYGQMIRVIMHKTILHAIVKALHAQLHEVSYLVTKQLYRQLLVLSYVK